MNGDGRDDVVLTPTDGRFLVSHSGTTGWQVCGGDATPRGNVKIGDLDGDGKGDIFWADAASGTWLVSYGGTGGWVVLNTAGEAGGQVRVR